MRIHLPVRSPLVPALALLGATLAPPAHAGWNANGVTVKSVTASIPLVSAGSDGAYGTIVAWQEMSSPSTGLVYAQHLLSTGDVDATWPPTGAVACNVLAARSELRVVPDRLGGAYVLWKEGLTLYANRIEANGAVAAGWPARGRALGSVYDDSPRPSVIPDAGHGFYAAWSNGPAVQAIHLGPANTGIDGWINGPRSLVTDGTEQRWWPRLALAPDGGVFLAWAEADPNVGPGAFHLHRFTAAGLADGTWPPGGFSYTPFDRTLLGGSAKASLVGLADDGRGGVFLFLGYVTGTNGSAATLDPKLLRISGSGAAAGDWPVGGVSPSLGVPVYYDVGPDGSYDVRRDGADGVFAGIPLVFDHGTDFAFEHHSANGTQTGYVQGNAFGIEAAAVGGGALFLADFSPDGPSNVFDLPAYLRVNRTPDFPGGEWSEFHNEPLLIWYGDIGLASSGDGGAVFFWSQIRQQYGLFARRFGGGGQVTGVDPAATAIALRSVRFVPGVGVRVTMTAANSEPTVLELFDVTGRRIAEDSFETGVGTIERNVPGTSALASGLYFARLSRPDAATMARVAVTR